MTNEVTMYRRTKLGVGTWRCWSEGATVFIAHAQCVGGSEVVHREVVPMGLAGRSLEEQVLSRVQSRVNKQRDRGYVDSLDEARTAPRTNQLDLPLPMLAKRIDDMRAWPGKVIVQPKLDGFRCLATRDDDGDVICYTRGGKLLPALEHVCAALEPTLPHGLVLDGEIYEHGKPLQAVASLAKRKQSGTENLVYHAYDCVDDGPFVDRYEMVMDVLAGVESDRLQLVPNEWAKSMDEVWDIFAKHRENGYEGAMVRVPSSPYDSGGRSFGLLKVKAREDDEFEVLDVIEDANGCGVLVCRSKSATVSTFRTLAPGSHDQKRFVLAHKDQYVGRKVTVEYANLTRDGVPFHAVATRWMAEL